MALCFQVLRAPWCVPEADGKARLPVEKVLPYPFLTQSMLLLSFLSFFEALGIQYTGKKRVLCQED